MQWYHYVTIMLLLFMVVSPIWFFNKVEKILFDAPDEPHRYVEFYNPSQVIPQEESMDMLSRDEKVLENLNMMIKNSKKKDVKNLWKIKKAEFMRELSWKRNNV